ncbi:NifB/NifX family molybdenum-iron cluster-binding protein [uncultured Ilyobacter sp.]|uniref:NifB/NifX family molybdenum-iron cluster-binding protein n=1 Tax=uncultured Ilyobacter sp. TaxID=544433 RepID=UPI0029C7FA63|nr:NifB/NifX family molybdenum-iron cluster-binding protein [uncultured Ilyobacter sp.]
MKIAISSKDKGIQSQISDRFGRADYFVIVDTGTNEVITIENTAKEEPTGAGGMAVRLIAKENVEVVIAPEIGPKAATAIKAFNIKAYKKGEFTTVEEAVNAYSGGKLEEFIFPTLDSPAGLHRA